MKITDLPMTGSFAANEFDHYEWKRSEGFPNTITLHKAAECENPHYEAVVTFPNGVISRKQMDKWEISVATVNQNGGEGELSDDYIDQFDGLFDHFFEKYGQASQIIL